MSDFSAQFDRQLRFLEVSCREYDQGNFDEAIRLATALRVLFHDTSQSISLLTHAGNPRIQLLSSSQPMGPGEFPVQAITVISTVVGSGKASYEPVFDRSPRRGLMPFTDWWRGENVYYFGRSRITRRTLVLWAANKDGGAHVDGDLPQEYKCLIEEGTGTKLSVRKLDDVTGELISKTNLKIINCHVAALRQMSYEVLNSPDILKLAGR